MNLFPDMFCRFCDRKNPLVYFGPKPRDSSHVAYSCTCLDCAKGLGWTDSQGDIKEGVSF